MFKYPKTIIEMKLNFDNLQVLVNFSLLVKAVDLLLSL